MGAVKVTIVVRRRWFLPFLLGLAWAYVFLGLVWSDDAATYIAQHGFTYKLATKRSRRCLKSILFW